MIKGKKILLGITGGIAAYKIPLLIRLLKKNGAEVKVVATPFAFNFVTPLTLSTLSENPVLSAFYQQDDGTWNSHISLGEWADIMVFAPLTANTLSKMSHGQADSLLVATYLSARCPVLFSPAMDLDMFNHPSTQRNIEQLIQDGHHYIPPVKGELASGLVGPGRMPEPEKLFEEIIKVLHVKKNFRGKRVLVTAGPTHEAIDPVRFIGNHSSGKMGIALANELAERGADVKLIMGPTNFRNIKNNLSFQSIMSAEELYQACMVDLDKMDIIIMAAAVADFTPETPKAEKIKKSTESITLQLKKTRDILSEMGKKKRNNQLLVGFALETDHEEDNALKKLKNKNLDFIVLNSLREKGAGFGHSTNKITIFDKRGHKQAFELKSKSMVAVDIVNYIEEFIKT